MKSLTTPDFWRSYTVLSPEVKEQARKAYRLWINNQFHPSLHFKKVGNDLWSGEDYYWIWIGSHDEYEALIG
ncbi:hypothetical protein GTQ43_06610 [Nostoc sp. KVJ3]|uniref:hypothetical protein n=1 Tax=Nostoc sp. KVJ3 TaxID=457945 RepID=UPI00223740FC|nr:hypothetical protein [Nostoc sp. KVJ3]MCW5313492.1 hypothetical protein [Nostoc sp. KVJ3]